MVLLSSRGVVTVILLLSTKTVQLNGLICNTCRSANSQGRDCEGQTQVCGVDQGVCSYTIEKSGSTSGITRSCEQERSCTTNTNQNRNCRNGFCKFCCRGDHCNRVGPSSCNCDLGYCGKTINARDPILFCYSSGSKNLCASFTSWDDLVSGSSYYLAYSSQTDSVASCQIMRRIGNSSEYNFEVSLRCVSIRLSENSPSSRRLLARLGTARFSAAKTRSANNRIEISCNRITLNDYPFDWICNPESVTCSFFLTPLLTTMQDPIPTNETLPEPIVVATLDYWVYIIIVAGIAGVILLAGFSRNIIKACKTKRFYNVNRILPRRRPMNRTQSLSRAQR